MAQMGLAPLHTWLPDAHSEAPSMVSALLSGALLTLPSGLFRVQQVCAAAGAAAFGQELFIGFGLLSMLVAAVFLQGQTDYKRLLAYLSWSTWASWPSALGSEAVGRLARCCTRQSLLHQSAALSGGREYFDRLSVEVYG